MKDAVKKVYAFGTIFILSNKLQMAGDRIDPQLSAKQWLFLAAILRCERDAPTLSEVAACIGSSRQNVKKTVMILERQGFVTTRKDVADARVLRIRITETRVAHLKRREDIEKRFLAELFSGISEPEVAALRIALQKLEENIKKMKGGSEQEGP